MPDDFVSLVKTVGDQERFRQELEKVSRALDVVDGVDKVLNEISSDLAGYLKSTQITPGSIGELRDSLSKLEVLGLTIAIVPKASQVVEIYNWVGSNIGHNVILDFAVNDALMAGAVIEFNGKYLDASLLENMN